MTSPAITAETVELLQTMIRNGCINDGTPGSGFEHRNADTLHAFLGDAGFDVARFEPTSGRVSLVARMEGREPGAPSLCLMGHTDVVPVNPEGWSRDPFGGELVDGPAGVEVWGELAQLFEDVADRLGLRGWPVSERFAGSTEVGDLF